MDSDNGLPEPINFLLCCCKYSGFKFNLQLKKVFFIFLEQVILSCNASA